MCDCYTVDPPPPCPFHLGDPEVNCPLRPLPFPLLPSHSGSVHGTFLASRGACSCSGRPCANSTHSDMIDNRKPLRGPEDFFFKCSCRLPRFMKKCRPGRLPGSLVPKNAPAVHTQDTSCSHRVSDDARGCARALCHMSTTHTK